MSESFKEFLTKTSDQTLEQEQELFRTSMKSQDLTPFEKYLQEAEAEELISRLANPDKNNDGIFKQNKIQRKLINMKVCDVLGRWDQKSHGGSFHYAFLFVDSYSSDKRLETESVKDTGKRSKPAHTQ
eukprot:gene15154-12588_t